MATVLFKRGLEENLPDIKKDGQLLLAMDTGKLYADIRKTSRSDVERIQISGSGELFQYPNVEQVFTNTERIKEYILNDLDFNKNYGFQMEYIPYSGLIVNDEISDIDNFKVQSAIAKANFSSSLIKDTTNNTIKLKIEIKGTPPDNNLISFKLTIWALLKKGDN